MNYANVVLVKHNCSNKLYLFEIPLTENLTTGTVVLVDTRHGQDYGECATDSMWADERALQFIATASGATLPLRKVTGRFFPIKFEEVNVCGDALETADQP